MKKTFLLLLISISLLVISCDSVILLEQENNPSTQITTWREQLEYAKKNNNVKTRVGSNEIYLKEYTYIGKINTEVEIPIIIEQLFTKKSVTVLYTDNLNFEIVPLHTITKKAKALGIDDPLENIRSQLEMMIQVGMELIELEWNYKGDTFYSIAIASDNHNGIIYDHIGYMILEKDSLKPKGEKIESNIPILKTGSESGGNVNRSFSKSDSKNNMYGVTVWEYSISCTSTFKGNGILYDRVLNASRNSVIGWSCQADIKTIGGVINSSDYHEFAWGYAYGAAVSLSLTWQGSGFIISGGGTGEVGTVVHRK